MNNTALHTNIRMKDMKILFIDNFDSFTYNLVDEFKMLGCEVLVYRNNISLEMLDKVLKSFRPKLIVISPGPSAPKDAGICIDMIKRHYQKYPIFGVCLGHQCLIEAFGGVVDKAPVPVHGKKSQIKCKDSILFNNIPKITYVGRYHSLIGTKIPDFFRSIADCNGLNMAIENQEYNLYGVQFHPESILTVNGSQMIKNLIMAL